MKGDARDVDVDDDARSNAADEVSLPGRCIDYMWMSLNIATLYNHCIKTLVAAHPSPYIMQGDDVDVASFTAESKATRLVIHNCSLSEKSSLAFEVSLAKNPYIESIVMEKCHFNPSALSRFFRCVFSNRYGKIGEIILEHNGLKGDLVR